MDSREATERFERAEEAAELREAFARRAALVVAVLAAFLAIASLSASRAQEEVLLDQVRASDTWNEFQANSLKKHINDDTATTLRKVGATDEANTLVSANNNKYIPRQQQLEPVARGLEHERDVAQVRHNNFQIAEAAFQLGIVLCSIAIIARVAWLVFAGGALGMVGLLMLLNGLLLVLKP